MFSIADDHIPDDEMLPKVFELIKRMDGIDHFQKSTHEWNQGFYQWVHNEIKSLKVENALLKIIINSKPRYTQSQMHALLPPRRKKIKGFAFRSDQTSAQSI